MADEFVEVARALAEKRAELETALGRLSAPATELGGISFGKRVGDGTALAVERLSQVAAHDRLLVMHAEVSRAQEKVEDETYGTCDRCFGLISTDRLQALPWAVLCIVCASGTRSA